MAKQSYLFLIGGIFSLMIAMGIGRFAYTPILPLMQNDLSFSNAMAGYLATSNYGGYLLGALLSGVLPLKKNKSIYLRGSLLISIITTFIMGLSHSLLFMLIIRFLSGISSAFIFVLASSIVLDTLASRNKTDWSGLFYSGVGLGIFLTGLITPSLNQLFHWEGVWVGLAIVSGILTFFVWIWLEDPPNIAPKKDTQKRDTKLPPTQWLPWLITAYGLEGLGYIVTGTFIISITDTTLNLRNGSVFLWIIVGLAAVPSCIIWSLLARKWGYVKSLIYAMAFQSFGIVLPVFWTSHTSLVISAILFGATFMGITTLATTLARQIVPSNSSQIIGRLTAVYAVGQMIGPSIAGVLATNTNNFNAALIGASGAVLLGAILLFSGLDFEYIQAKNNIRKKYN